MAERRKGAEFGRVADEDVEPPVTLVERRRQLVDLDELAQIDRHQSGAAAGGMDPVVDFFEAARGARRQYDMRPFAGKPLGDGGADAARGAGDQRDLAGEPAG